MSTILLDLDDTLLGNSMDRFLPPYFARLGQVLRPYVGGGNLRELIIACTRAVQDNTDPATTNWDVFMQAFSAGLGQPAADLRQAMDRFYAEEFPHLQVHTTFRPEAPQVVRLLQQQGHRVVIATNPLFPEVAIRQRLNWAGLGDIDFAHITTMENSHFCKPNPRYYQEILARLDTTPAASWMVGNDAINDIAPAHSLGLTTWWITTTPHPASPSQHAGPLADLLQAVQAGAIG